MSQVLIGGFLVAHGLITASIGLGAVTKPNALAMTLPAWFAWWPGPFGRSWFFEAMHLGTAFSVIGGLVWLAAGLALIGGGIGWLGMSPLEGVRYSLLVAGASMSLVALALYFHPIYIAAILINVAIVALLWGRLTATS